MWYILHISNKIIIFAYEIKQISNLIEVGATLTIPLKYMKYYVEYNCQYMAIYKSVKACLNHINRKGWKNDENNMLRIVDENGDEYDTINGIKFEDEDCIDSPLTEKEFDNLVDLMVDNKMDFELKPATNPEGYVVLKFKNGSFFRCLLKDYEKAVDYINDPSLGEGY